MPGQKGNLLGQALCSEKIGHGMPGIDLADIVLHLISTRVELFVLLSFIATFFPPLPQGGCNFVYLAHDSMRIA